MAWWEFLEIPQIKELDGILLISGAVAAVVLVGGLGIAYAYSAWEAKRKAAKAAERAASARAPAAKKP